MSLYEEDTGEAVIPDDNGISLFEEEVFSLLMQLARPIWNARASRAKLYAAFGFDRNLWPQLDGRRNLLENSLREIDDIVRKYVKEHTDGQAPDTRVSPRTSTED